MLEVLSVKEAKTFVKDLPFSQQETAELIGVSATLLNSVLHKRGKSEKVLLKLTAYRNQRRVMIMKVGLR